jgi:hypothetical protein
MTAPAPYKTSLAVAGLLYYRFIRKRLYTEKPAPSLKLSTQSSQKQVYLYTKMARLRSYLVTVHCTGYSKASFLLNIAVKTNLSLLRSMLKSVCSSVGGGGSFLGIAGR